MPACSNSKTLQIFYQTFLWHLDGIQFFSDDHPWYGAAQGGTDSAICWAISSNHLIKAYASAAHHWQIYHPNHRLAMNCGLDAFMDDTSILLGKYASLDISELVLRLQFNLNLWQELLQVSGGTLNPPKCSWSPVIWKFDSFGNATLSELTSSSDATFTTANTDHGTSHCLKYNKPSDAV